MEILLVNDDGIYSPGLAAIQRELSTWGHVTVVAPAVEQSGVGHSITYLHPIVVHQESRDGKFFGWRVEGSPADCVKLGIIEFCPVKPNLIVSGINHGSNVGINVLYSGTVAGAIEGAFFGITSIAVSQWRDPALDLNVVAKQGVAICRNLYDRGPAGGLWNVNFPASQQGAPRGIRAAKMAVRRQGERVEKRTDPRGRSYYWSGLDPIKSHHLDEGSDIALLTDGYITVTPLHFDLTEHPMMPELERHTWPEL